MSQNDFYEARDQRTVSYTGSDLPASRPVQIEIGDGLEALPAGQLAILSLANQAARVHRRIHFVVRRPETDLYISVPFADSTLGETLLQTCTAIDPWGEFTVSRTPRYDDSLALGIGTRLQTCPAWHIGADRSIATLSQTPVSLTRHPGTARGAALAACLGASALFRKIYQMGIGEKRVSSWNLREGSDAALGPKTLEEIDVGRVLMVGAGAVGGALVYWLHAMGAVTEGWAIIDPDVVEIHNTNRHMLASAADAGWGDSTPGGKPIQKHDLASTYMDGQSEEAYYGNAALTKQTYDLILCLANERDVRTKVAMRNAPIVLHATTGEWWQSQLHRHIAGIDDCIRCRMNDVREPEQKCSTSEVENPDTSSTEDAALPFLSAASGLMLTTSLQRLHAGELHTDPRNDWRFDFESTYRMVSGAARTCRSDCNVRPSAELRRKLNQTTRWQHLDAALQHAYSR